MNTQGRNEFQLPLPLDSGVVPQPRPRSWRYLLAETIGFSKDIEDGIRIQKPARAKLAAWLIRLIQCGQCETIYVENLSLTKSEKKRIDALCESRSVSVINISVNRDGAKNIVVGPW
ncbi:deoxyguanosinetriphosphate triphosphohydrolase [Salinimonas sp. HHU 13199]|uniref:Deoxyguanosinetriphosphate triphosphohydrolase n=1 Tax=Salinimonas profundi TaxID=2729140 RepID=A0ABR8LKX4_9ALTE|nr:deoxyguanosinetriphosphate triphosphohydrolase [Salinimonas profundi]MBD3584765.1 deoxyguanosinetriphosphate triphosphohydrolase [Salinimonas profundi]